MPLTGASLEAFGAVGGFLMNSAFLPQIYKSYTSRSTKDLSWLMLAIFYVGTGFQFAFGVIVAHPSLCANAVYSFLVNTCLMTMKWRFEVHRPLLEALPESPGMSECDESLGRAACAESHT